MNMTPTRTLVLVNLLALASLAYLWVDPNGKLQNISWIVPAPVKPVIAVASIPVNSINSSDTIAFAAMLERPIFAPDRRPPPPILPPPPPPPPPPPDPLANVQLLGLISGDLGGVLIRADAKVRQVKLSDKLGDWTLQAIGARDATFVRAEETRVIRLEYVALGTPQRAAPAAPNAASAGAAHGSGPPIENLQRMNDEDAAMRRNVDAMRAKMNQKKP